MSGLDTNKAEATFKERYEENTALKKAVDASRTKGSANKGIEALKDALRMPADKRKWY